MVVLRSFRPKELDKTLQEWSEGGDGRGGTDVVRIDWAAF